MNKLSEYFVWFLGIVVLVSGIAVVGKVLNNQLTWQLLLFLIVLIVAYYILSKRNREKNNKRNKDI